MEGKSNFNKLTSYFFKSSTKIFEMGLSSSSILVFLYLCSNSEEFNPSTRYVAKRLDVSPTTVTKALRELVQHNIIELITKGKPGHSAEYRFLNPKGWK